MSFPLQSVTILLFCAQTKNHGDNLYSHHSTLSVSKSCLPPSECLESNHLNSFHQFQSYSNLYQNLPCYYKSLRAHLPTSTPAPSSLFPLKQPEINHVTLCLTRVPLYSGQKPNSYTPNLSHLIPFPLQPK